MKSCSLGGLHQITSNALVIDHKEDLDVDMNMKNTANVHERNMINIGQVLSATIQ